MSLRYVKPYDVILPEDFNSLIDYAYDIYETLKDIKSKLDEGYGLGSESVSDELDQILNEIETILGKMRKLKFGDIILASDHNVLVDFANKVNEFLNKLQPEIKPLVTVSVRLYQIWSRTEIPLPTTYTNLQPTVAYPSDTLPDPSVSLRVLVIYSSVSLPSPTVTLKKIYAKSTISLPSPSVSVSVS